MVARSCSFGLGQVLILGKTGVDWPPTIDSLRTIRLATSASFSFLEPMEVSAMRATCSLVLTLCFLAGTAFAGETASVERDLAAAKRLLELPEASEEEYAQVEGTWELVQDTDEAKGERRVKTHRAGKTTVTVYGADGQIIGRHNSEYKLKKSGMARIFVFFNIVPATGPSKGREFPGPFYYTYSARDNRFIEAYGLLKGDDRSPRMIFWRRGKNGDASP